MKSFMENFRELDIDELLSINGGYGSSSGGGYGKNSGGTGSYGKVTTSSGNQTSWDVWVANKDGRNSSGEVTRPYDPYRNLPRNSGNYEATSFVPDHSMTSGGNENSILKSIKENNDKLYNENGNGYCCDNWVEEVLSDAGYDPAEFMYGDSTALVQQHIDNLESGSYSTLVPNTEGAYVVYMNNSDNSDYNFVPHAGILTVESDGRMLFHHNSSSNDNNGVASDIITSSNGITFDGYGYDSFYFQQIN